MEKRAPPAKAGLPVWSLREPWTETANAHTAELLKEAKSAISGAGPSTGPMLRSCLPTLSTPEHATWHRDRKTQACPGFPVVPATAGHLRQPGSASASPSPSARSQHGRASGTGRPAPVIRCAKQQRDHNHHNLTRQHLSTTLN
jgi:hypothetical protein